MIIAQFREQLEFADMTRNQLCLVLVLCVSLASSTPLSQVSLQEKIQFPIPNPFGQILDDNHFYLIESSQEIYHKGSSSCASKQVSEYFNLQNGDYFSYHTNVNDYKPIGEPYAYISSLNYKNNTNQMFLVTNPNGYPVFQCKIDESNQTKLAPWSYEWPLNKSYGDEKTLGHIYGISALWLSAINEQLKSSDDPKDLDNWSNLYNLWFKDESLYKYKIGFTKPPQTPAMDDAELAEAVSKTTLDIGKVTEYLDGPEVPNRQFQTYRYFWVQKFLVRVQPSQDILLQQLIRAKEKCLSQ